MKRTRIGTKAGHDLVSHFRTSGDNVDLTDVVLAIEREAVAVFLAAPGTRLRLMMALGDYYGWEPQSFREDGTDAVLAALRGDKGDKSG